MELCPSINNTAEAPAQAIDAVQFHCHGFNGSWLSWRGGSIARLLRAQSGPPVAPRDGGVNDTSVVIGKSQAFWVIYSESHPCGRWPGSSESYGNTCLVCVCVCVCEGVI